MSAICRLASRKLAPQLIYSTKQPEFLTLARHVTLKTVPFKKRSEETYDHDDHNMKLKRPQSPHLTIYAYQLTSTLSITHRMTGAALAGYTTLLGAGALVLPHPISHYLDALQAMHPSFATLFALKFVLVYPFSYHFFNGIRHLTWDAAKNLSIKGVYNTGYIMLGSSAIFTAVLCCM